MAVLLISDMGSYIGKKKSRFKITAGATDKPASFVPANRVEGIIIDAKTTISSGAFELLSNNGIPVIWNGYKDDGMILLPYNKHGSVEVRKEQFAALSDERGISIATKISYAASFNRKSTLLRIGRNRSKFESELEPFIEEIQDRLDELLSDNEEYKILDYDLRQKLMNNEAMVARSYYDGIQSVLDHYGWDFEKRSRRPAQDPFNAILNYSYAILEGQLTHKVSITGLDVFAGFLHTDRSGRESLVLDIIEEFRQIVVDEVLIKLVMHGKLHPDMFEISEDGVEITKEVKNIIVPAIFDRLKFKIQSKKLEKWLLLQPRSMVRYLRGIEPRYNPFLIKVRDPW